MQAIPRLATCRTPAATASRHTSKYRRGALTAPASRRPQARGCTVRQRRRAASPALRALQRFALDPAAAAGTPPGSVRGLAARAIRPTGKQHERKNAQAHTPGVSMRQQGLIARRMHQSRECLSAAQAPIDDDRQFVRCRRHSCLRHSRSEWIRTWARARSPRRSVRRGISIRAGPPLSLLPGRRAGTTAQAENDKHQPIPRGRPASAHGIPLPVSAT